MNNLKFIIVPIIALGVGLSMAIGMEHACVGDGVGPTYYGSPFIFKHKSLVFSMTYFYSISGILLNTLSWSVLFYLLHSIVLKGIIKTGNNKIIVLAYKAVVIILIVFAGLNIAISSMVMGRGFEENSNYWHFNMEKEASQNGMNCQRKIIYFKF